MTVQIADCCHFDIDIEHTLISLLVIVSFFLINFPFERTLKSAER